MNLLSVDPAIPAGLVKVSIVRDPTYGGGPGCTTLGGIDLSAASQSEIPELRVQNDAATLSAITFKKLSGPFVVGGAIVNPVTISTSFGGALSCASLGNFTATTGSGSPSVTVTNNYAGTMTISGLTVLTGLSFGGISGSVVSNIDVEINPVLINGNVSGTLDLVGFSSAATAGLEITGNIESGGSVIVRKTVKPYVRVNGNIAGTLDIRRDVGDSSSTSRELYCGGDVTGLLKLQTDQATYVHAGIQIDGNVLGLVHIVDTLNADSHGGFVRVLGALGSSTATGEIRLQGGMSSTATPLQAYVCINYDGAGRHGTVVDQWYSGSTVVVGSTTYTAPNDTARVHAAPPACGHGDVNGDGGVDFADIDPFVALLSFNPAVYPGLAASVLYMGDCYCDGIVDFADIDAFVELLFVTPCTACGTEAMDAAVGGESLLAQSEGDAGGDADPLYVATYLDQNTSAANHDLLLASVAALANNPPESAHVAWNEVLAILTGQ